MNDQSVAWTDVSGQARSTVLSWDGGSSSRPVVLLLHGASGSAADMVNPLSGPHAGYLYDAHSAIPALVDRGWHDYPNTGFWSVGALDAPATGQGWQPRLRAAGFGTAWYSQVDSTGLLANPTQELHAIVNALTAVVPGRGLVLLADSRGGLLARRWLADLTPGSAPRSLVRGVVTLHTPHLGTGLATKANAIGAALSAVAASYPAVAAPCHRLAAEVATPDLIEMAPGSTFLTQLASDEQARNIPGQVPMFTWGGTSPRLVRARNWAFTADSAVPHVVSVWPPKVSFHWQTTDQELVAVADGVPVLAAIGPELATGGDLLVTEPNTRLPWSTSHTTNPFSHADTLLNPTLQQQVLARLGGLAN
jgi:alpha-beta hydrolase superfamily lysophospholipase